MSGHINWTTLHLLFCPLDLKGFNWTRGYSPFRNPLKSLNIKHTDISYSKLGFSLVLWSTKEHVVTVGCFTLNLMNYSWRLTLYSVHLWELVISTLIQILYEDISIPLMPPESSLWDRASEKHNQGLRFFIKIKLRLKVNICENEIPFAKARV